MTVKAVKMSCAAPNVYTKVPDGGWGWTVALAFFFVEALTYGIIKSFGVFFNDLMESFDETNSRISWIISICVFVQTFTAPLSTVLSNRFGHRVVVMAGGVLISSGMVAASFARLVRDGARDRPQVSASFATGPRQDNGIFYEIRTYEVKPSRMKEFVELVNQHIHLRMAHSELVGFWTTELGAMNKAIHIWKYDNFAHRTAVRTALANDKDWQGKFISPALTCIEKQHNEVAYLVPWCQLGKPPKEGGVYEWVTFQMKPGGPALWGEAFRAAISTHINTGYTKLIGVFHTEYGLLNTVHVIWWNENADNRASGRHKAHEDARVVAAVRESIRFLESQQNMLLVPLPFSPLK